MMFLNLKLRLIDYEHLPNLLKVNYDYELTYKQENGCYIEHINGNTRRPSIHHMVRASINY